MSTINFTCPHCSRSMQLPAALEGKQGKCPSCKIVVKVANNSLVDLASIQQQPIQQQRPPQQHVGRTGGVSGNLVPCCHCNKLVAPHCTLCPHCGGNYKPKLEDLSNGGCGCAFVIAAIICYCMYRAGNLGF